MGSTNTAVCYCQHKYRGVSEHCGVSLSRKGPRTEATTRQHESARPGTARTNPHLEQRCMRNSFSRSHSGLIKNSRYIWYMDIRIGNGNIVVVNDDDDDDDDDDDGADHDDVCPV